MGGLVILPNIPESVWWSRAWLKQVRAEAHRRMVGADAVLWCVLAIVAGGMPYHVKIDTGVRSPLPPSLFAALAGYSGTGKSSAWRLARALVPGGPDPLPISTGEGLLESCISKVPRFIEEPQAPDKDGNPRDPKLRKVWERRQTGHNVVAMVDEGAAMFRHMDRSGNIIAETLRSMWSGAEAGQANADADRRRVLAAGSYNVGLVIGVQPSIAGRLLADVGTGFAQRFVWVAAADQAIPPLNPWGAVRAPTLPLPWSPPLLPDAPATAAGFLGGEIPEPEPVTMSVDPGVVAELATEQLARARGETTDEDEQDSQRAALRLKVAGVLTWMDTRLAITGDDWALAGALLDTSDAVRDALTDHAAELVAAQREAVGIERAEIDAARTSAEVRREQTRDRVIELLVGAPDGLTHNEVKKVLSKAHRPHLDPVIAAEEERGLIVVDRVRSGGRRYRLVSAR